MKIKITQQRKTIVSIPDAFVGPEVLTALHDRCLDIHNLVLAMAALPEQNPEFDMASALTTTSRHHTEYVVRCVQYTWYSQLDYIFDNKLVSPDFVSELGSPLVLYAMQAGPDMFRYMLRRGAKLTVSGDFVHNTGKHAHVTALFCANGNQEILNVLFNVGLIPTKITNRETLDSLLRLGVSLGRPAEQLTKLLEINGYKTHMSNPVHRTTCRFSKGDTPLAKVMTLVHAGCTSANEFREAGETCSSSDIRMCMAAALSHTNMDTYTSLTLAFPKESLFF